MTPECIRSKKLQIMTLLALVLSLFVLSSCGTSYTSSYSVPILPMPPVSPVTLSTPPPQLADPIVKWKYAEGLNIEGSPIVVGGVVYYVVARSDGSALIARDGRTGQEKWRYLLVQTLTPPVAANGIVYVGIKPDGLLYALDANTGKLKWSFATVDEEITTPTLVDGVAYFGSGRPYNSSGPIGHIYAV